jgi:2-iminobutanoate/2-iminopropanoate deaminase
VKTLTKLSDPVRGLNGAVLPLSAGRVAGDWVFLSGQLALRDGNIAGDTIEEQTRVALDNVETLLALARLGFRDVVKTSVWLTCAGDFPGFNTAYAERFAEPYPARSTVVSGLLLPGALIEIEVVAQSQSGRLPVSQA